MTRATRKSEVTVADTSVRPSLFETVGRWLAANDWIYEENSERGWFSMRYRADCGSLRIILDTTETEDTRRLLVFSSYPVYVPEGKRKEVGEFITRANSGMILGNFELDFADGEIRFKTVADVCRGEISDDIINRLMVVNISTANRYLAPLLGVAFGNVSPIVAIEQAEKRPEETLQ